uniref:Serpentine receptor class gamma n=1 Tax=Strongyloides venezuelensis TaxID=75913 RepID=A0A0K0F9Z6_STRVS
MKTFPGMFYGLSVYLPCIIGFGHLTQVINRFVIIKFPLSFDKIFNKWLIGGLFVLQFLFPSVIMIWCWNETGVVTFADDGSTTILELQNYEKQYNSIIFGICSIIVSCAACCFFGMWSFILVVKMRQGNNASQLRREINLFVFVGFEILAQILLIIAAVIQVVSGYLNYNPSVYYIALHLYPFCEDLLCLVNGLILLITCQTVRTKYITFYKNLLMCKMFSSKKAKPAVQLSSNRIKVNI